MMRRRLTWLVVALVTMGLVEAGRVPQIPSGRRTQYLFLLDNGGYKYGYDTGLGSSEKALATHENQVKGVYSYKSPSGPVTVEYTSGVEGFKPNKVVVPPASADGYARKTTFDSSQYGATNGVPNQYLPPVSFTTYNQRFPSASPASVGHPGGYAATVHSADGGASDGSYSFAYNTGDHSRQESADANGNVVGQFSFVAKDDNARRTVNYKAGAESGFVATGSHLPSTGVATPSLYGHVQTSFSDAVTLNAASSHSANAEANDGSYSFAYNAGDHSRQESADANGNVVGQFSFVAKDDNARRTVNYKAGAESGFVATGSHFPSAPSAGVSTPSVYSQVPTTFPDAVSVNAATSHSSDVGANDGSYSFAYNAGDHSRQESADANGNVVGQFSFVAKDDNARRTVNYKAGAESGFVATGSHFPSASSAEVSTPSLYSQVPTTFSDAVTVNAATSHSSNVGASDGSYSFAYNAGDHSRQESADANGNVVGQFSFVPKDDNARRTVNYKAGAESGFVASGAHLPSAAFAVGQTYQSVQPLPSYQSHNVKSHSSTGHAYNDAENQVNTDGSYSFAYNAGDHSRQEAADSNGNVVGSFSFVAKDDGVPRKVDYVAGAEQGFVARGGHLPKQPSEVSPVSSQSVLQKETSYSPFSFNGKSDGSLDDAGLSQAGTGDASYSFSYTTTDQSRHESSDPQGNVVGTFSYVGKDGLSKTVNYEAGAAKGFLAKGSHLPEHSTPLATGYFKGDLSTLNQHGSAAQSYNLGTHSFQQLPELKSSVLEYSLGNLKVKNFLKPNVHRKVGYVFDS